jgi:ribosomal protein L29
MAVDAHKLSDSQLKTEIASTRTKLFTLRNQAQTEKVENTSQFVEIRKDIARLLTEQSVRRNKMLASKAPAKKPAAAKAPAAKKVVKKAAPRVARVKKVASK